MRSPFVWSHTLRKPAAALLALILASASGLACAQPAPGAPPATPAQARLDREVRCMLLMSAFAGSSKERQAPGLLGVYFFAGRILQISPQFDFTSGIRSVGRTMTQQIGQAEMPRCAALVRQAQTQLQAAQTALNPPRPAPPPAVDKP
jgi:hypothetical protein